MSRPDSSKQPFCKKLYFQLFLIALFCVVCWSILNNSSVLFNKGVISIPFVFLLKHLNYVHSEIYRWCHHSPSADWLFINLCTIYLQKTYSQWYNYSRINLNQLHSHQNNSSLSIWMVHKSSLSICDTSCGIILGGFLGFVGFLDGLRGSAETGLVVSYVLLKNIIFNNLLQQYYQYSVSLQYTVNLMLFFIF